MVRMMAPFGNTGLAVWANAPFHRPLTPNAAPTPRTPSRSRRVMVMARQSNMSALPVGSAIRAGGTPRAGEPASCRDTCMTQVFADLGLARRLEETEGRGNAAF